MEAERGSFMLRRFVLVLVVALVMATGVALGAYNEAPELAALVAAGELPPVEERLPPEPLVITPVDSIGRYGGDWNRAWLGSADSWAFDWLKYEGLVRFDRDGITPIPNIATHWEISDCGLIYDFFMLEGIRWSDGHPLTVDDIMFWYEDAILHDQVGFPVAAWFRGVEVQKLGDFAVRFVLPDVNPYFLVHMAQVHNTNFEAGHGMLNMPKHYLSQFHADYTDLDELQALARAEGYNTWYELFEAKAELYTNLNPDLPVITPWQISTDPTGSIMTATRNPYYWKVDTEGNQLPYINRIRMHLVETREIVQLKAMAGELDFQLRHLNVENFPLLAEEGPRAGYQPVLSPTIISGTRTALYFNQTYVGDEYIAELLRNKTFRHAVSFAVDRDEVNEFTAMGIAIPRQATVNPLSQYFVEELEMKYIEFDPAKANELLDSIGLDKRDRAGYRLRPDGARLELILSPMAVDTAMAPAEIIKRHLEAVGISVAVRPEERSLWQERATRGQHQITPGGMSGGFSPILSAGQYFPLSDWSYPYPLHGLYVQTDGRSGWPLEGNIAELLDIYYEARSTLDDEARIALVRRALEIHAEEMYFVGIISYPPFLTVIGDHFKNVPFEPDGTFAHTGLGFMGRCNPEQFWIDR